MSAKRNLSKKFELKNNDILRKTYFSKNNFSLLNLPSLLFYCPHKIIYLVMARITNLYNFVMNSTV